MAAYFARKIIEGHDYNFIFSVSVYKRYQDDTDVILELEGYGHLIPAERRKK